ncbi:MAG: 5-(carboxyamino)imidazole ribonucleotide synthase [Alphaproteobacteria bacterium]|nr:5-(carboxyamino)imidazole ribonucleotide synthase [Alphaproteobacteria bacterium]
MAIIPPGSTIGILGGGQLGRMSALAAAELGYRVHVFTPEEHSPAAQVSAAATVAAYEDEAALKAFAENVDVVTFEFENVPAKSAELLEKIKPVRPGAKALYLCRHRLREKEFVNASGGKTAPFCKVDSKASLKAAAKELGFPCILKTCELGYDGKGQWKIAAEKDIDALDVDFTQGEFVLEGFVPFAKELSVIVARGVEGEMRCFPVVENIHKNHILHITRAPANVQHVAAREAERLGRALAEAMGMVGLLAVELFMLEDGTLLVNEMAPRPHNSGHYSIDACVTDQFEQFIRAVCGLPLGDSGLRCPAEMVNLIGDDINAWAQYLALPNAKLHLYGKSEARPGRKMGHVTLLK